MFKRRYKIDEEEKLMLIVCQSTEHPNFPENKNKWRVKNYWSYIVIKPHKDFDKVSFIKLIMFKYAIKKYMSYYI